MSDQISRENDPITQLNEATQKQAVYIQAIQSLTQENNELNIKLLPEVADNIRWWKFW